MSLRSKTFKGAIVLTCGQAVTQALSFVRNIIIARLLNPEDMGIAATFAITITLLEMISNLAVDMLLVQAKDGDDPVFQGTAHLYQVFRGLLVGLLIAACAPLITWLFKTPQAEWAFRLVALVPVFRGFMHLDWKRLQRKMQYRTSILVELIPQLVVTLAAYPVTIWLGDYSAVLWLVLTQSAIGLLTSHLFAKRPYRLNWDRKYATRLLVFGWPLLINGLLMFGALQGDRLIIGTFYSMAELGVYSVAFSLIITIAHIITKLNIALVLPLFSRVQDQEADFNQRYALSVQVLALVSGICAIPFITFGDSLISIIFGSQYLNAYNIVPWLGGLLTIRIFRLVPTAAAIAHGDTKTSMTANMFRFLGVIVAVIAAYRHFPLKTIVIAGIFGEMLALFYITWWLAKAHKIGKKDSLSAPLVITILIVITGLKPLLFETDNSIFNGFSWLLLFWTGLIGIGVSTFPMIRVEISLVTRKIAEQFNNYLHG